MLINSIMQGHWEKAKGQKNLKTKDSANWRNREVRDGVGKRVSVQDKQGSLLNPTLGEIDFL